MIDPTSGSGRALWDIIGSYLQGLLKQLAGLPIGCSIAYFDRKIRLERRFLLHVLPSGLVRIRQFGFLANRNRKRKLELCRALLGASQPTVSTASPDSTDPTTEEHHRCPICLLGRLILIEYLRAEPRVLDTS